MCTIIEFLITTFAPHGLQFCGFSFFKIFNKYRYLLIRIGFSMFENVSVFFSPFVSVSIIIIIFFPKFNSIRVLYTKIYVVHQPQFNRILKFAVKKLVNDFIHSPFRRPLLLDFRRSVGNINNLNLISV